MHIGAGEQQALRISPEGNRFSVPKRWHCSAKTSYGHRQTIAANIPNVKYSIKNLFFPPPLIIPIVLFPALVLVAAFVALQL